MQAVIDIGTNTFQLLIGEVTPQGILVYYKEDRFVRLGKGGISKGEITSEAIDRAIDTLLYFRGICLEKGIHQITAIATSALRSAENQVEVLQLIQEATHISIEVINGEQEAEYIYEGVKSEVTITTPTLIMDIGGGSIEFIHCDQQKVLWKQSFEIGAQRLYDQFMLEDPISNEHISAMNDYLKERLNPLLQYLKDGKHTTSSLIGSAGTFDTLQLIQEKKSGTQASTPFILSMEDYTSLHERLITSPRNKRLEIPGLIPERVDMIVPASCALHFIMKALSIQEIVISTAALREGILVKTSRHL
ncbi:phosphatase [Algivirga pacifica]|uniref:Ppx/GppA phosphatase N-terminal domain-containing protein n=1 Tax=Algivirga pacifica TaxID=1162670 RepID=A0ABP9DLG0_9BACT